MSGKFQPYMGDVGGKLAVLTVEISRIKLCAEETHERI